MTTRSAFSVRQAGIVQQFRRQDLAEQVVLAIRVPEVDRIFELEEARIGSDLGVAGRPGGPAAIGGDSTGVYSNGAVRRAVFSNNRRKSGRCSQSSPPTRLLCSR